MTESDDGWNQDQSSSLLSLTNSYDIIQHPDEDDESSGDFDTHSVLSSLSSSSLSELSGGGSGSTSHSDSDGINPATAAATAAINSFTPRNRRRRRRHGNANNADSTGNSTIIDSANLQTPTREISAEDSLNQSSASTSSSYSYTVPNADDEYTSSIAGDESFVEDDYDYEFSDRFTNSSVPRSSDEEDSEDFDSFNNRRRRQSTLTVTHDDQSISPEFGLALESSSGSSSGKSQANNASQEDPSQVILENPSLSTMSLENSNSTLKMPLMRSPDGSITSWLSVSGGNSVINSNSNDIETTNDAPHLLQDPQYNYEQIESGDPYDDTWAKLTVARNLTVKVLPKEHLNNNDRVSDRLILPDLPPTPKSDYSFRNVFLPKIMSSSPSTTFLSPSSLEPSDQSNQISKDLNIIGFGPNEKHVMDNIRYLASRLRWEASGIRLHLSYCQPVGSTSPVKLITKNYIADPRYSFGMTLDPSNSSPPDFSFDAIAVIYYSSSESYLTFDPASIYNILAEHNIATIALSDEVLAPSIIEPSNWHILGSECAPKYRIRIQNKELNVEEWFSVPLPSSAIYCIRMPHIQAMLNTTGKKCPQLLKSIPTPPPSSRQVKPKNGSIFKSIWSYLGWVGILMVLTTYYIGGTNKLLSYDNSLVSVGDISSQSDSTWIDNLLYPTATSPIPSPNSVGATTTSNLVSESVIIPPPPSNDNRKCRDVISRNTQMALSGKCVHNFRCGRCFGGKCDKRYELKNGPHSSSICQTQSNPPVSDGLVSHINSYGVMVWNSVSTFSGFLISILQQADLAISNTISKALIDCNNLVGWIIDSSSKGLISNKRIDDQVNKDKVDSEHSSHIDPSDSYSFLSTFSEGVQSAGSVVGSFVGQFGIKCAHLSTEVISQGNQFTKKFYESALIPASSSVQERISHFHKIAKSEIDQLPNHMNAISNYLSSKSEDLNGILSKAATSANKLVSSVRQKFPKYKSNLIVNGRRIKDTLEVRGRSLGDTIAFNGRYLGNAISVNGRVIANSINSNGRIVRDKFSRKDFSASAKKLKVIAVNFKKSEIDNRLKNANLKADISKRMMLLKEEVNKLKSSYSKREWKKLDFKWKRVDEKKPRYKTQRRERKKTTEYTKKKGKWW